jgi:Mce-associated membrane protein
VTVEGSCREGQLDTRDPTRRPDADNAQMLTRRVMAEHADTAVGELNDTITDTAGLDADALEDSASTAVSVAGSDALEARRDDSEADHDADVAPVRRRPSHVQQALVVGLAVVTALAALVGWLGFRAYQSHRADQQRSLFLQVGRQGAINLTTIDWQHADTDVERILNSATGTFFDDFSKRSQPFIDVVKQAQSTSVGTVTEAGLESATANDAQVLLAVSVKTSIPNAPEQNPRAWRMRVSVQKVAADAKVANVEFVP